MDGFWAEMDRLGKDRNPYHAGFLQFVGVAESREEAYRIYREPAEYFYGRCLHIDPRDEVAAQLKEVAHKLNAGHLMLLLQFGNMSKDLAKYNTRLFAEKVMPQLK